LLSIFCKRDGNAFKLLALKLLARAVFDDGSLNVQLLAAFRKKSGFIACESNQGNSGLRLLSGRALFLGQGGSP
jgi:hypothetical protein